jgi:hypothetical protein
VRPERAHHAALAERPQQAVTDVGAVLRVVGREVRVVPQRVDDPDEVPVAHDPPEPVGGVGLRGLEDAAGVPVLGRRALRAWQTCSTVGTPIPAAPSERPQREEHPERQVVELLDVGSSRS